MSDLTDDIAGDLYQEDAMGRKPPSTGEMQKLLEGWAKKTEPFWISPAEFSDVEQYIRTLESALRECKEDFLGIQGKCRGVNNARIHCDRIATKALSRIVHL